MASARKQKGASSQQQWCAIASGQRAERAASGTSTCVPPALFIGIIYVHAIWCVLLTASTAGDNLSLEDWPMGTRWTTTMAGMVCESHCNNFSLVSWLVSGDPLSFLWQFSKNSNFPKIVIQQISGDIRLQLTRSPSPSLR